jgi:N-acetylneuraminic acid mutarotase
MLIWGGYKGKYIRADSFPADGAIYDPATGKWEKLPEAPIKGRFKHTAIWTGKEMIVWGGNRARFGEGPEAFRGATYDPRSHKWKKLPKGPIKRNGHTAIWTGRRMIIWGGFGRLGYYANGASYDPASGKWERIPKAPIPGRSEHTAIWTGKKMIVWGGQKTTKEGPVRIFADGAIYDPESRKWEKLPKAPIKARIAHTAIWTGKKMIIWGGIGSRGSFGDGAAYDPESGSWEKLPKAPVEARAYHTAIWTGRRMIIWGGRKGIEELTDGAIYEPKVSSWKKIPEILTKISSRTAIWTGKEMIIWGAKGGAIYTPPPMREKD